MLIFPKAYNTKEQIKARVGVGDGVEVLFERSNPDREGVAYLNDNFPRVNFEVGVSVMVDGTARLTDVLSPHDQIREASRRHVEKTYAAFLEIQNQGYFTIHNIGYLRQLEGDNHRLSETEKQEKLGELHTYLRSIDTENRISLENSTPASPKGLEISQSDFGILPCDFPEDMGVTFDIGHYGMSLMTYAVMKHSKPGDYCPFTETNPFLVRFGTKERAIMGWYDEREGNNLDQEVIDAIKSLAPRIKVLHVTNFKEKDSYFLEGPREGFLDIEKIIRAVDNLGIDPIIVPELRERDYVKIPIVKKFISEMWQWLN